MKYHISMMTALTAGIVFAFVGSSAVTAESPLFTPAAIEENVSTATTTDAAEQPKDTTDTPAKPAKPAKEDAYARLERECREHPDTDKTAPTGLLGEKSKEILSILTPLTPVTAAQRQLLAQQDTLHVIPLIAADLNIQGIERGFSQAQVEERLGKPVRITKTDHFMTLHYGNDKESLRCVLRTEQETADGRLAYTPQVDAVFLAKGDTVSIGRNIFLHNPVELVLRRYGVPHNVLRDAAANVYYLVYEAGRTDLIFAVAERKVQRVALMEARYPYHREQALTGRQAREKRDFTLMGFGLDEPFIANRYNMWNNQLKRGTDTFWLYNNYGVAVDGKNKVKRVFLLTNSGYTDRGATLGYHVSTVLGLYGYPDHVDHTGTDPKGVDVYYYSSPYQPGVYLAFVIKRDTQYVDDVILTEGPLHDVQNPTARYGL
ncbi:hypothetical protein [uncultured Megasphaera sp.]|uniref:hypothetical protein n=1 Tax=uncultured Megasphaera sp. TaxID=165188 RepID=UPI00288C4C6E|nr:hypothetical protein [uncultured Megasphaera sp.]